MVLSNKKLKQRLRAELVESVASTVAKSEPKSDAQTQPKSQPPQSLKVLLDSATQRPRLSKREKRREAVSLRASQGLNGDGGEEGDDETSKKKRKREESGRVLGSEKNGLVSKSEKKDEEMKNPRKKTKRKKKKNDNKKKKKKGKNEEEKEANDTGKEENKILEANEKNYNSEANQNFDTKVYVGGIPFYSSEDDIRSYFEGCGTINEVDCMTFPESGKFRGIAIICFKTEAAAKRALALNGSDMGGLFLTIVPYKANRTNKTSDFAPKSVEGYYRIYVGNLSWDITEDKLRDFFSDCKITSIRFGNDKETGEFRGYAHVDFSNSLSFTMALKLDQKVVCGRPVVIRCAVPLKKEATNEVKTDPTTVSTLIEINPSSSSKPIEPVVNGALLSSIGAGKTRRRTCYECGEKGHISSDCPKNQTASSIPATTTTETTIPSSVPMTIPVPVIIETAEINTGLSSVSAGKLRRRTCYECGEKGHMSSDCPKKQTSSFIPTTTTKETTIPSAVPTTAVSPVSTVIETDDTITGLSSVSAGKLRRRTCYECGEKGHISSDCPKQQNDGLTNFTAD